MKIMILQKYILDKKHNLIPVDFMTWAVFFENVKNRQIALDKIGKITISTIFLGINHNKEL